MSYRESHPIFKKQIPHRHHRIFGVDGIFRPQQPLAAFAIPQRIERFEQKQEVLPRTNRQDKKRGGTDAVQPQMDGKSGPRTVPHEAGQ